MRIVLLLIICLPFCSFGQKETKLKEELDSMYVLDQRNRQLLTKLGNNRPLSDSLSAVYKTTRIKLASMLWAEQAKIDTSNLHRVVALMNEHGYPGKTLVGTPTNEFAFYILQHARQVDAYLPAVKKAAESGELPLYHYALMLDQSLMRAGKPQMYGSQVTCKPIKGSAQSRCFVWPIDDYRGVNERRKQAGFPLTVAENANRVNASYDPALTIELMRKTYRLD
ncbi:DUF6624 domain-containing protein [Spirosoma agri]|uniref:Uncharacterized protein n=1 Tax=Spirosoma agri TaxID=1987381 RepID=A0A6M0IPQ3_9BACT|nr:DUF6624 domain-containing protein [Spirosoma agri]NEU69361.1 hypothetical protein [Spirosoma agri]